ncbi:unnamed protein product [Soboliphyme baturini]|uniref:DUF4772 domain-containing protein n=1 Tax=Soboliphyme baturini TaxID=241478 RepID=A0A183J256_9BILA|nr:unnamed protein product [Soboliphyme baturini]
MAVPYTGTSRGGNRPTTLSSVTGVRHAAVKGVVSDVSHQRVVSLLPVRHSANIVFGVGEATNEPESEPEPEPDPELDPNPKRGLFVPSFGSPTRGAEWSGSGAARRGTARGGRAARDRDVYTRCGGVTFGACLCGAGYSRRLGGWADGRPVPNNHQPTFRALRTANGGGTAYVDVPKQRSEQRRY